MADKETTAVTDISSEDRITDLPDNVNVHTIKDMITDPGTVMMVGLIALLLPFFLVLLNPTVLSPVIHDIYVPFSVAVVGLLGAHAVTDASKTKYVMDNKKNSQGDY